MKVENNRITGVFGQILDRILTGSRKEEKRCRYMSVDFVKSIRYPNGTYSGYKQLFIERKMDLYCKFEVSRYIRMSSTGLFDLKTLHRE